MRTFLALCFSVGTTRRLAEAVEREMPKVSGGNAKLAWVPPANYHVTLKFFGDIPPESLDAIIVKMKQRCANLPPVELKAKGFGTFPGPGTTDPARVLWVGITDSTNGKQLTTLHAAIESDMHELGFAREARTFQPHLTVARVLETSPSLQWKSDVDLVTDRVPEIVLYESLLTTQLTTQSEGAPDNIDNIDNPDNIGGPRKPRPGVEYLARARVPFLKK